MTGAKVCPACDAKPTAVGQLLCGYCWRRVPGPIQKDVRRAWRAWRSNWLDGLAMRNYAVAQQAAMDAVIA